MTHWAWWVEQGETRWGSESVMTNHSQSSLELQHHVIMLTFPTALSSHHSSFPPHHPNGKSPLVLCPSCLMTSSLTIAAEAPSHGSSPPRLSKTMDNHNDHNTTMTTWCCVLTHRKPNTSSQTLLWELLLSLMTTTWTTLCDHWGAWWESVPVWALPSFLCFGATHKQWRRYIQGGIIVAWRIPNGTTKGEIPDQDLSPEHWWAAPTSHQLFLISCQDKLGQICLDILKGVWLSVCPMPSLNLVHR